MNSLLAIARSTVLGFLIAVLNAFVLAELGVYSRAVEWSVLILLSIAGVALGLVRARERLRLTLFLSLPGILVSFIGIALIMLLPARGEWILGGWDPGVYINQGIIVERSGSFKPMSLKPYDEMTESELLLFTRGSEEYRECFPGVPLDVRTGKMYHYFFRLMPSTVAIAARCGGMRAATRVNTLLGLMVCLVFIAALIGHVGNRLWPYIALLGLITQPIWLYHLRTPTSEMLQLLLVLGLFLCTAKSSSRLTRTLWIPLLMLAAIVNRVSFTPFAAIFIVVLAISDLGREDRGSLVIDRSAQLGAIAIAMAINLTVSAITIVRLRPIMPILFLVTIIALFLALTIDLAGRRLADQKFFLVVRPFLGVASVLIALSAIGIIWVGSGTRLLDESSHNLHQLAHYVGHVSLILAFLGTISLLLNRNPESQSIEGLLFFLYAVSLAMLLQKGIRDLYPWATRRYLVYTIPLVAVLSGHLLYCLLSRTGRFAWVARSLAVLLLAATGIDNGQACWRAWSRTEYDGISAKLSEVASAIPEGSIVVTDHAWWGTPLVFIHGRSILNGQHLYKDPARAKHAMAVLHRLQEQGKTVLFLTSTSAMLSIYSFPISARLKWETSAISLNEIAHHRNTHDFNIRTREVEFRLWILE